MSLGNFLWKEAKMPITETRWWGDALSGKKPFTLQSHNAIHADATKELGNNWATRNPDATAAMVLATIFSGGAASGAAGGAGGGAAAGGAAAGGAAAGGSAAAGSTAAGGASYGLAAGGAAAGSSAAAGSGAAAAGGMTAAEAGAGAGAGYGLAAGGAEAGAGLTAAQGASGAGLSAGAGQGTTLAGGTAGANGTGLYAAQAGTGATTSSGPGLLGYTKNGMQTMATAQQAKGLLTPPPTPQAQAAPIQNKPADFSGLLQQYVPEDKWSQQYAQYVQGLLGGYRG